ncbi:replication initiator [Streptomyces sp. SID2999]|uniref:replication initiator n=1 Tax=Streptomyces sp. SID2999 TaxID=2690258 RepID=UPI0031BB2020
MAAYAAKCADASGTLDRAPALPPRQGRGATLLPRETPLPCTACDGTGQARPLPRLAVTRHIRQMIRTSWELGKMPEFTGLKLCKWAHMLGFRGRFSIKPRSYHPRRAARRPPHQTGPRHAGLSEQHARRRPLGLPRLELQPRRSPPEPGRPLGGSRIRPRPGLRQEEAPGDRAAPSVSAAARSCCR